MAYSDITFQDKNIIKRWLQFRRLDVASRIVDGSRNANVQCILDFGAGNGEFCKVIAQQFPTAKIICYEPAPSLMAEAKENLISLPQIRFCSDIAKITDNTVDLIFCLEVLEHLPETETKNVLEQFNRLLSSKGNAVVGVPVETGIPALYKGFFRMFRRFNAFDASVKNVLLAALFFPPNHRPVSEIAPGLAFHYEHMGFEYRKLQMMLNVQFRLKKVMTSPFPIFGPWLNPEVTFLVQKAM